MHKQALAINTRTGATMSSREIAALTGKRHPDVVRDIKNMLSQLEIDVSSFAGIYFDSQNRQQTEYCLDRIHVECLLTGYSIPLRMKVLERLAELEHKNDFPAIPSSFADALRLAADQQEQIQQLQIEQQRHVMKIDALEKLLSAGVSAPDFCRRLNGVNTMKVNDFLLDSNWLFLATGARPSWRVTSYARDKYMTEKAVEITPRTGATFTVNKPVLLKAGAKRLVSLYMAGKLPMKKSWNDEFKHDLVGVMEVVQ